MTKHPVAKALIGAFLIIMLCVTFLAQKSPSATPMLLPNGALSYDSATLHYTKLSSAQVASFSLDGEGITPLKDTWTAYTEGFIPRLTYEDWIGKIQDYCASHNRVMPTYFYNFYENEDWVIIGFAGTINDSFILDKKTQQIRSLHASSEQGLVSMYPFHFQIEGNQLTVLGGKANSYDSLVYTAMLSTGSVTQSHTIPTDYYAKEKYQTALLSGGKSVFVGMNQLGLAMPSRDKPTSYPLGFQPTGILSTDHQLLVYSHDNAGTLRYELLDTELKTIKSGILDLPSPTHAIISIDLKEDILSVATAADQDAFYQNYISDYDLSTNTLISCIGLEAFPDHTLSGVTFSNK